MDLLYSPDHYAIDHATVTVAYYLISAGAVWVLGMIYCIWDWRHGR